VVCDNGLGNGRSDGVDLSSDTSSLYSDANIEVGELVLSDDKNRLEYLQSHDFGLDVLNRLTIDLDETPSLFGERDGGGRLLPVVARGVKKIELKLDYTHILHE